MSTIDMTALNSMFKVNYQNTVFKTVVTRSEVFDLFKQSARKMSQSERQGRYIELSHMFGNVESIGARPGTSLLPVPGNPLFVNGRVSLKKNYAVFQTDWEAMHNAASGPAAFGDFTRDVMLPTVESFTDDLNRQTIGYGPGILCRVDVTISANVISVDAPYGIASDTDGALIPGLRRGMSVVFGPNSDGSGLREGGKSATILSVDFDANAGGGAITVDYTPAGVADNDYLWRGDDLGNNAPVNGVESEMMGLLGHIDDGTYLTTHQNINRTTYPEWRSTKVNLASAPYSAAAADIAFLRLADDQRTRGKGVTTHLLTTPAVFRGAFKSIQAAQGGFGAQQNTQSGSLMGGASTIGYNIHGRSVQIRGIDRMPKGMIFALDASTLWRYGDEQGEWDTLTGSMWRPVSVGGAQKDQVVAIYRYYGQTGCSDPRKSARGDGIDETLA